MTTTAKTYSVLLVDGPSRGITVPVVDAYVANVFVPVMTPVEITAYWTEPTASWEPSIETAHYKITRIKMFGQYLLVGSVTERPSDHDLFTALASERAQRAVIQ